MPTPNWLYENNSKLYQGLWVSPLGLIFSFKAQEVSVFWNSTGEGLKTTGFIWGFLFLKKPPCWIFYVAQTDSNVILLLNFKIVSALDFPIVRQKSGANNMVSNCNEKDQLGVHLGRFTYLHFKRVLAIAHFRSLWQWPIYWYFLYLWTEYGIIYHVYQLISEYNIFLKI